MREKRESRCESLVNKFVFVFCFMEREFKEKLKKKIPAENERYTLRIKFLFFLLPVVFTSLLLKDLDDDRFSRRE